MLAAVTLFLLAAVILIGMVGDRAEELGTRVDSRGLDQAGGTGDEANEGGSLCASQRACTFSTLGSVFSPFSSFEMSAWVTPARSARSP
jgi:hypothetical protein